MVRQRTAAQYTYQDLKKDLAGGKFYPVYLFMGDEDWLISQGIKELKDALLSDAETSWNFGEFQGKETGCDEIAAFLSTLPVFGGRKVAVLRDFDRLATTEVEPLLPLLENMPEHAHLLMTGENIDQRTKRYRMIRDHGKIVAANRLDAQGAAAWVMERSRDLGLSMSGSSARYLVSQVGISLGQLNNELEKLACYKDEDSPEVGIEDIELLAVKGREIADNAIFRFTDAVADGNEQLAVKLLSQLLASGREPLSILAMIARQFRIIAFAWEASRVGMHPGDIGRELGVPAFAVQRALTQGQRIGPDAIRGALAAAAQADREIKSGFYQPRAALELLVIRLTRTLPRLAHST
ncbi:MAG: DNA polymerase III subunit delta [Firmicutes bacterium]|jgi:DNA polymerase-3 subunit delta|nr:DNA polymerase III subunit delta [Bacillota bacterium]